MPTYHPDRVERQNKLYDMLKNEAGLPIEVIVVCDNPKIFDKLKYDILVPLQKRVGFTRAVNIGEKFATNRVLWWIDDYVIPEKNWAPEAYDAFFERFPDGRGIMELSMYETDCPKSLSTRDYLYDKNNLNLLWPEYIHCGDTELWYRSSAKNEFYMYPKVLWHREKIWDACKTTSDKCREWDVKLRLEREALGWPMTATPELSSKMHQWAIDSGDPSNIELYKNLYNL